MADHVAGFGNRDEAAGRDQALDRMLPAHQCLKADQLAVGQIELGLVMQAQMAVFERALESLLDVVHFVGALAHGGRVEAVAILALRLGRMQCGIGGAQQGMAVFAVIGRKGDADGGRDGQAFAVEFGRFGQGVQQLLALRWRHARDRARSA